MKKKAFIYWLLTVCLLNTSTIKTLPTIASLHRHCVESNNFEILRCHKLPLSHHHFPKTIKILELLNIDKEIVDINVLVDQFPKIENITIQNGHLKKFKSPTKSVHIKVLKLYNMKVESISSRFLHYFPDLETLNLQQNNLQSLKKNFSIGNVQNLYLAGNKWNCSMDLDWIFNFNHSIIRDIDNLTCHGEPHGGKNLLTVANFMRDIKADCPKVCSCNLNKIVRNPHVELFEPMIEVNCANKSLKSLPDKIPNGTKILKLESNEIEDLQPLKGNKLYRSLLEIYLDNNQIKTIEDLEGSYWLRHFRVFSLTGNKLTELPTYALDNALAQNGNMPDAVRINLGGNPWRCDCVFTPVFQEMLQKFTPQIRDIRDVKCSYVEGDENSLLPIIELSRSSVCRLPTEYSVKALNLLNGILASLIIFILGKLAYDYYYFKKTGRLPWIVTKMP